MSSRNDKQISFCRLPRFLLSDSGAGRERQIVGGPCACLLSLLLRHEAKYENLVLYFIHESDEMIRPCSTHWSPETCIQKTVVGKHDRILLGRLIRREEDIIKKNLKEIG